MERSSSSSSSSDQVINVDWISKLPDDVLLMILSRLTTEKAIRTSLVSRRWKHLWKQISHLVLDMRMLINSQEPLEASDRAATLLTKVLNNHNGHVETCVIDHFTYQSVNGTLDVWIRLLTCVKHTKVLTLEHHFDCSDRPDLNEFVNVSPNSFSHPSLTSLSLTSYILENSLPFSNSRNLRTLKLSCIMASEVGVFNSVLASCPSLQVLVLGITCFPKSFGDPLKIENKKLKILQLSTCRDFNGISVSAASLDILAIDDFSVKRVDFFLTSPRVKFNRNFWLTWTSYPHISYNISKEEKSIAHEEFVKMSAELLRPTASLSVSIDLMSRTEVERLRQVLCLWPRRMIELEIIFKVQDSNGEREENECLWDENNNKDPFPNAEFRVGIVWMYNFSGSEEEFALASCLIRQGTVVEKMMIRSTSFPAKKKLEIEAAVAKLQELQTEDQWEELSIECF